MKIPSFMSTRTILVAMMAILLTPVGQAQAVDIVVNGACSLENAIRSANEQAQVEPRASCETGNADDGNSQVDENGVEIPGGRDVILLESRRHGRGRHYPGRDLVGDLKHRD